ncbi:hypothetical protein Tsubulata_046061, partial [Turnera subulata]
TLLLLPLKQPDQYHSINDSLNEAALVITVGKLVAPGTRSSKKVPGPTLDTPWRASDHHSYLGSPNLRTP